MINKNEQEKLMKKYGIDESQIYDIDEIDESQLELDNFVAAEEEPESEEEVVSE